MPVIETPIPDLFVIEPKVFEDHRGYFFESYNQSILAEAGLDYHFVQDNESKSSKNVLRGLHYQLPPMGQAKLVRVTTGAVLDVVCDIREGSDTYGHTFAIELSAENKKQLLIPRGFAHGFLVLSEVAVFSYKCDNFYSKEHDSGLDAFDPQLKIDWGVSKDQAIISEKDLVQPAFGKHKVYSSLA